MEGSGLTANESTSLGNRTSTGRSTEEWT